MKYLSILLILSLIVNAQTKGVSQQVEYLSDFFEEMLSMKQEISQMEFFRGLELLESQYKEDSEFEVDNIEIYTEHYDELTRMIMQQSDTVKLEAKHIQQFKQETFPQIMEQLRRIIIDKEKLIESDVREASKLKQEQQHNEDSNKKNEDFTYLQQRITEVMEGGLSSELFPLLELIESKIVIGLFRHQPEYAEVDIFMKGVDIIFKEKSTGNQELILSLISLIQSVITEMRLNMQHEQLIKDMEALDKHLFYAKSKNTHITARDNYIELLKKLENVNIATWSSLQHGYDNQEFLQTMQSSQNRSEQVGKQASHYLQEIHISLKGMMDKFLER